MTVKDQSKIMESLNDKYSVVSSQVKLLESSGVKHVDDSMGSSSKIENLRENIRAEVNLIVNQKVVEEVTSAEERLGKRIEESEKKFKSVDSKIETLCSDYEGLKKEEAGVIARLDEVNRALGEVTINVGKKHSEDIGILD